MRMSHEGPLLNRVRLWNQSTKIDNQGNEWWIFSWDGKPIETWKDEQAARYYMQEFYKWNDRYGVPRVRLFRCIPGIGFVRQES